MPCVGTHVLTLTTDVCGGVQAKCGAERGQPPHGDPAEISVMESNLVCRA